MLAFLFSFAGAFAGMALSGAAFWLHRRRTHQRMLTLYARALFLVERQRGESNESLQRRCRAAVAARVPVTVRWDATDRTVN